MYPLETTQMPFNGRMGKETAVYQILSHQNDQTTDTRHNMEESGRCQVTETRLKGFILYDSIYMKRAKL